MLVTIQQQKQNFPENNLSTRKSIADNCRSHNAFGIGMMATLGFKRHARQSLTVCIFAGLLGACGAGGGNPGDVKSRTTAGNSPAGSTTPRNPGFTVLTFEKPIVSATVVAAYSATLVGDASLTRPSDFGNADQVYAYITDATGVILPEVQFSQTGPYSYRVFLHTNPTLPAGNYKGKFDVKVCRDVNCVQQFPGSPMDLPYDITVLTN